MNVFVFRLSIFGSLESFGPTTENVIAWTQGLKDLGYEFLPSILQTSQQTISNLYVRGSFSVPSERRLKFVSADGKMTIRILRDRLDIEFPFENIEYSDMEKNLDVKLEKALELMKYMLHVLNDTKGIRMAYFMELFIPETGKDFSKFYQNNNVGLLINGYSEECVEWSHRFNSRVELAVDGDKNEICNVILMMESGFLHMDGTDADSTQSTKGMRVSVDINTLSEKTDARFSPDNLECFAKNAQRTYLDLIDQINEKLLG